MHLRPSRSLIAGNTSKVTLLVVENDATSRLLMELMLIRDNFTVLLAANSAEALDTLTRHHVNGIVLGTLMSGINNSEFCRVLRARTDTCSLPILIILSTSDAAGIERSKQAGADDHLTKPVIAQALVDKVRDLLRRD